MKRCGKCKEEKSFSDFGLSAAKKDGYQSSCKQCRSFYMKEWYAENSVEQVSRVARHQDKIAKYLYDTLSSKCCVDCGESRVPCLQFDHINRKTKSFNLADASKMGSMPKTIAEVKKCEVRCANCHAVRTAEQFSWYKKYI